MSIQLANGGKIISRWNKSLINCERAGASEKIKAKAYLFNEERTTNAISKPAPDETC